MGEHKRGGCKVVVECGCDDHGGHGKKSNCCDTCESAGQENTFVAGVDLGTITPVGTELAFALLENPAGSGKNLVITSRGLAVTGSDDETALVRFYFDPVLNAPGTPGTPVNANQQTPPLPAGVGMWSTTPNVASTGTLIDALNTGSGQSELTGTLVLGEGHSLLITGRANAENTRAAAFVRWTECKIKRHHDEEPQPEP